MILDLAPLQVSHLTFFGASFAATFALLQALVRVQGGLRSARSGGAMMAAVTVAVAGAYLGSHPMMFGLASATALIIIIGAIDETVRLSPSAQLIAQTLAAACVAATGWVITEVSHPLAPGVIEVNWLMLGETLSLSAFVVTVLWLVFLMNSINWLDGSDGLASSVGLVALITLAVISLLPSTQDGQTLTLAMIGTGALLSLLLWNWAPARLYLGTSGAWFLGLYLGIVAIVGGGKIATTLLVLVLPAVDAIAVVLQRLVAGQPPWRGDTIRHLHFRLQAQGLSPRSIAIGAAIITAICGWGAVTLQTLDKLILLAAIGGALFVLATVLWLHQRS